MNRFYLISCLVFICFSLQAQQTEVKYLSGRGNEETVLWDFYCTAGRNSGKWDKIPVPSNWELQGFGAYNYGHDKERINEKGLYKYRFSVPSSWKNKKVNIVFDGSMTDTEVKINGKSAGPVHQGAYYRFRYDISRLLKFGGENLLEVTVSKASSNASVEEAERRADFWVFGGIFRPVWLEALPPVHIERFALDAQANGKILMDVFMGGNITGSELVARVKTMDGLSFGAPFSQKVVDDSTRMTAAYTHPQLWSAEFPNRYIMEISLWKEGKLVHQVEEPFGFRSAEFVAGDGFYLNGVKIKFKGVNRHTFWPTSGRTTGKSISIGDVLLMKEMNMNSVRMSHYPPDEHFLEVCDSLGLYVIDELTAWQKPPYETKVGRKLVKEMITRDVNHPSVVMWANGNEGGFNFELLPDYARYDIQKRKVIHPWLEEKDLNTHHYITYDIGTQFYFHDRKVFFPTEFQHGLYDGGHGAGLDDFWNLMLQNPLSAGGFLWDFADQGIVRTDKGNILDASGNQGSDGIVGPYREKEGSFFTIKEIWAPVFLEGSDKLTPRFDGKFKVQNRYEFTNLNQCRFSAEWVRYDFASGNRNSIKTAIVSPDIAPGFSGILEVLPPEDKNQYDALYITATDPHGKEIYTWYRTIGNAENYAQKMMGRQAGHVASAEQGSEIILTAGDAELRIDRSKGIITAIRKGNKMLPLSNGPRFSNDLMEAYSYALSETDNGVAVHFQYRKKGEVKTNPDNYMILSLSGQGWIGIEYSFEEPGIFDHVGITFDFPEGQVKK